MKNKRILWLINHTTLRKFEVSMLKDLGFEIYCPKMYPYDEGNLSASVDYSFDDTLTLPQNIISKLNNINFYEEVDDDIIEIINEYFGMVFIAFFPKQLKYIVDAFEGNIVLRAFGLGGEESYTKILIELFGIGFIEKIEHLGNRFIFGAAYENLAEIECDVLKSKNKFLPIGLSDAYVNNKWTGGDQRILFVCPRINTSPYFKKIYKDFKENFKGFDYLIGGAQPIAVLNDKRVLGFIPWEQYEYNMTKLDVMFYHSQESRHLHFHPIEAIKNGMPLIFMAGGMLDKLGGTKSSGRCTTLEEAKIKIKNIFNGDRRLIKDIIESQTDILKNFEYGHCRKYWSDFFDKSVPIYTEEAFKRKKIGVILPGQYTGGILDYTIRFLSCLQRGINENKSNVELVFGYIDHDNFKDKDYFKKIRALNISIRPFCWKETKEDYAKNYLNLKGIESGYDIEKNCIMFDGIQNFSDCDYLIFMADRGFPNKLFMNKPYSVVVHDYIQRYLPEFMGDYFEKEILMFQRNADKVIVTSRPTYMDAVNYGGIPKEKLILTPLMFDKISKESINKKKNFDEKEYFIWPTNISRHKNHKVALNAINEYYLKGGTLKCIVTGADTEKLDSEEDVNILNNNYLEEVRNMISKNKILKTNIIFMGNLEKQEYLDILSKSKFIIHPGFADNGNGAAVDAAFLGVSTISSDYPAMRYIDDTMKLNFRFYETFNYEELANLLLKSEKDYKEWNSELPDMDSLSKFSIDNNYKTIYDKVKKIVRF